LRVPGRLSRGGLLPRRDVGSSNAAAVDLRACAPVKGQTELCLALLLTRDLSSNTWSFPLLCDVFADFAAVPLARRSPQQYLLRLQSVKYNVLAPLMSLPLVRPLDFCECAPSFLTALFPFSVLRDVVPFNTLGRSPLFNSHIVHCIC